MMHFFFIFLSQNATVALSVDSMIAILAPINDSTENL